MNPLNMLRGWDAGVAAAANQRAGNLGNAAGDAALAYQKAALERLQGRDPASVADEIGGLYHRMGRMTPKEGSREAVIQGILNDAAGRVPVAEGKSLDSRQIAALLDDAQRNDVQRYMVEQRGPGLKSQALEALAGLNRTMARDDWQGGLARTGLYSGAVGGGTAGAAGLLALIDYLQGGSQPEA